jgi:uncharacterized protein (DUF2147 family)
MKPLLTALFALTTAASASAPSPVAASLGDWRTAIGATVRIEPCGAELCLRVVKLSPNPPAITDQRNPDATLRHRAICGLTIGSGFRQTDTNKLGSGHLYDPISGHTYRGTITPTGNQLKLRGYVLFTLFGRTETWSRVSSIASPCR